LPERHPQEGEDEMETVELTVAYDNYLARAGLRTAHGFACVVRTAGRGVLFDTGGSGQILLENMGELGLGPNAIDSVVLSHMHWDHIGGLDGVLEANPNVAVYVPAAFSPSFMRDLKARARAVVPTERAGQVAAGVWTTDVLERPLVEQALYVETAEGVVVITGCAHPGVVQLVRAAQRASGEQVAAVLGGFHMARAGRTEIGKAIKELKELRVRRVGPCHCSGDPARRAMRESFADGYMDVGVGTQLSFPAAGAA
jgi:7,8-dihydropterin-6-yl-methyl-4-(beta-D-ribofuranosyl)aminobenzene 5'-phosphate synthase